MGQGHLQRKGSQWKGGPNGRARAEKLQLGGGAKIQGTESEQRQGVLHCRAATGVGLLVRPVWKEWELWGMTAARQVGGQSRGKTAEGHGGGLHM